MTYSLVFLCIIQSFKKHQHGMLCFDTKLVGSSRFSPLEEEICLFRRFFFSFFFHRLESILFVRVKDLLVKEFLERLLIRRILQTLQRSLIFCDSTTVQSVRGIATTQSKPT